MGIGQSITGPLTISWLEFFKVNAPTWLYFAGCFFLITKLFKGSEDINAKEFFAVEYEKMGQMSKDEKKSLVVCLLLFLFLITSGIHKIDAAWIFAVVPMLLFIPGVGVAITDDVKNVNFSMLFFTCVCMGIGSASSALNLGTLFGNLVTPLIEGQSVSIIMLLIYGVCLILHFLMTPLAIISAFTVPFLQITTSASINPLALYLLMVNSTDQIFLPYQTVLYLIFFSFGMVKLRHFAKYMGIKTILNVVYVFIILIPYWKMIGFLVQ
jgi:di/tricarboxylate transporter